MNKNNLFSIIFWALVFIATASAAIFLIKKPIMPLEETEDAEETEVAENAILLSAKIVNGDRVEVVVQPQEGQKVFLTAFSLKATLSAAAEKLAPVKGSIPQTNPDLIREKWGFPIIKADKNEEGGIVLELSGYHLGEELYELAGETVLATIVLASPIDQTEIEISPDEENTKFLGGGAIEQIQLISE